MEVEIVTFIVKGNAQLRMDVSVCKVELRC